jgi:hypothetical protein
MTSFETKCPALAAPLIHFKVPQTAAHITPLSTTSPRLRLRNIASRDQAPGTVSGRDCAMSSRLALNKHHIA